VSISDKALELRAATHEEVTRLGASGDDLAAEGRHKDALTEYNKAWNLIP
jgi:hypothetical protein